MQSQELFHRAWLGAGVWARRVGLLLLLSWAMLAVACGSPDTSGQSPIVTSIAGLVFNAETGTPIPSASVSSSPETEALTTNADGKFTLAKNVKAGQQYLVTASASGFTQGTGMVTAVEGQVVTVNIGLTPASGELVVDKAQIDLTAVGDKTDVQSFSLTNKGAGSIDWSLSADSKPWLSVTPQAGTLTKGQSAPISVSGNASAFAGYGSDIAELRITGKGGNLVVKVTFKKTSAECFALVLDPATLEFGTASNVLKLYVKNQGGGGMKWNASTTAPWLSLNTVSSTTSAGGSTTVDVVADRTKLTAAGEYDTKIDVVAEPENAVAGCGADKKTVYVQLTKTEGLCYPGQIACVDDDTQKTCNADGSAWITEDCLATQSCTTDLGGTAKCRDHVCTPNAAKCLDEETAAICQPLGMDWSKLPCDPGTWCQNGKCVCKPACGNKQCGADGCGQSCGQCTVTGTACKEPEGLCVNVPKYEVSCDDTQPHGAGICVSGEVMASAAPVVAATGCVTLSSAYCLIADSLEGIVPVSDAASSASYRIDSNVIE